MSRDGEMLGRFFALLFALLAGGCLVVILVAVQAQSVLGVFAAVGAAIHAAAMSWALSALSSLHERQRDMRVLIEKLRRAKDGADADTVDD